jgi:hypothetical protein
MPERPQASFAHPIAWPLSSSGLYSCYAKLRLRADFHNNLGKLVATPSVTALQRSDVNEFLFADVGTEASGMVLSVVSLFARQGNDPWREANRLADLPKAVAADSLAHSIADLPPGQWNLPDAALIAARLTGLLPARPARAARRSPTQMSDFLPSARSAIVLACVALGLVYAVSAVLRPAPARFDGRDVGSFAAPAPGDASQSQGPNSR